MPLFNPPPTALPPDGAAGGDLSGTYPNPEVAQVGGQALPVPLTLGGTGATTAAAARTALGLGTAATQPSTAFDAAGAAAAAQAASDPAGTAATATAYYQRIFAV